MAITNATRLSDFAAGIGTEGAILQIDNANQRIGIGTTNPSQMLEVAGIVTATAFYGDGSNLEGITSAGLGTAISDVDGSAGAVVYYTDDLLTVTETTTINPPASASAAYTQYRDVKLDDSVDLIIETGDDFIPDVLGLGTDSSDPNASGNGVFDQVYADIIKNKNGLGAPAFANGLTSVGVITATGGFTGNVTGDVTGNVNNSTNLSLKTNNAERVRIDQYGRVMIGTDTAGEGSADDLNIATTGQTGITIRSGTSSGGQIYFADGTSGDDRQRGIISYQHGGNYMRFYTNASERLRITEDGAFGIGGANYGTSGQVMTSQGNAAAPQWADAGGGAWEVVQSTTLSGSNTYIDFNGWSNAYQKYQLVFNDVHWTSEFRIYCRFYKDATSGNAGTLKTASQYKWGAISNTIQSAGNIQSNGGTTNYYEIGKGDYGYLWNGYLDFPMRTWTAADTYTGSTCMGLTMRDNEVFPGDACFYDDDKNTFLTGIRLYFFNDAGSVAVSPTNGRFTILRMKYS